VCSSDLNEIVGSESSLGTNTNNVYHNTIGGHTIDIDVNRAGNFHPSYNIAPTNSTVIIYMEKTTEVDYKYVFESLKFGLVPFWSKPSTIVPEDENAWSILGKEIGAQESKYFNCRKETLQQSSTIWNSCKKTRCVVPIQGYFEWKKQNNEKIPHFVHDSNAPLMYLAGMYSHNYHYKQIANINQEYLSTFTIVTGPAIKSDTKDISWLHSRKPIVLKPGSKAWFEWLEPNDKWLDKLFDTSLNTKTNQGFTYIEAYRVSKDVGQTKNNGEYLLKRETNVKPQKSIMLFFQSSPKKVKRQAEEDIHHNKKVKHEVNEVKSEMKQEERRNEEIKSNVEKEQVEKQQVEPNVEHVNPDLKQQSGRGVKSALELVPEPQQEPELEPVTLKLEQEVVKKEDE
jgi:putative SOS response-associated peptidase YedK